jgi:hypothetical protein
MKPLSGFLTRIVSELRDSGGSVTSEEAARLCDTSVSHAKTQLYFGAQCGTLRRIEGRPARFAMGTGVVEPFSANAGVRALRVAHASAASAAGEPTGAADLDHDAFWRKRLRPGAALQSFFGMQVPQREWTGARQVVVRDDPIDEDSDKETT